MVIAWLVFPLVLGAISLGFGLLTERLSGGKVAGALLLPLGFAGAVVVSTLATAWSVAVTVPGGRYDLWLSGSFGGRMEVDVDGRRVGAQRHRLEHSGQLVIFGSVELAPGRHRVSLRYSGADLHPGSTASFGLLDRFVVARTTEDVPVRTIPAARARELCGRTLDWVEAIA